MLRKSARCKLVVPAPVYIEKKECSEDIQSEGEMAASKKFRFNSKVKDFKDEPTDAKLAAHPTPKKNPKKERPPPEPREEESRLIEAGNMVVWLLYCVCSGKTNSRSDNVYDWAAVLEVVNGLFVMILLVVGCYTHCAIKPWMALHFASIVLTLGFFLSMEEPLHTVIAACRPVRLLLIFCVQERLAQTLKRIVSAIRGLWRGALGVLLICFLYSLMAMQLFMGDTDYKCRATPYPMGDWPALGTEICGSRRCPAGTFCSSPVQYGLPSSPEESHTEELFYGLANFNSLPESFLTMFQLIRTIGWSAITIMHSDYFNREMTLVFFVSFVIVGPLVLMNLLLALLYEDFEKPPLVRKTIRAEAQIGVSKVIRTMNTRNEDPDGEKDDDDEDQPREVESVIIEEEANS